MKKQLLTIVTCLLSSTSLFAGYHSADGLYVGGFGGANWEKMIEEKDTDISMKPGYIAGLFAGYKFCNQVRLEGEVSYRNTSTKDVKFLEEKMAVKGNIESIAFLANALYDFDLGSYFTPYVGLGLGYASETSTSVKKGFPSIEFKGKDHGFAWQGIAGISRAISCNTDLGLEYRYLHQKSGADHAAVVSLKRYF